jgi:hypothetical protein
MFLTSVSLDNFAWDISRQDCNLARGDSETYFPTTSIHEVVFNVYLKKGFALLTPMEQCQWAK